MNFIIFLKSLRKLSLNREEQYNFIYNPLVDFSILFNDFCETFFFYLKYIFVAFLVFFGIKTLFNYKFFNSEDYKTQSEYESFFNKLRMFVGIFFIFTGIGIFFNYFLYFLILILEPLPDQYIFDLLNSANIDHHFIKDFSKIIASNNNYEKTLYYCIALGSFEANLRLILTLFFILSRRKKTIAPLKVTLVCVEALIQAILLGFSTYLKLFL